MKRKKNGYYRIRAAVLKAFSFVFKAVMAVFFLFPFYWMVTTAFKTYGESILFPPTLWPETWTMDAFRDVGQRIDILYYLKNSVIVAVSVVVLQLFINIPAAYGFARYEFRGKRFFWALVMLAFMIPTQITFIPALKDLVAPDPSLCGQRLWDLSHAPVVYAGSGGAGGGCQNG